MLINYKLLVSQPTLLDGYLTMFISQTHFLDKKQQVVVKNIYFSDHDTVMLHISSSKNNDVKEDIDFDVV